MVGATLSDAARSCWGKSRKDDPTASLALYQHFADSAGAAETLWQGYLPLSTRRLVEQSVGPDLSQRAFVWLAACHDLGKASRAFAVQNAYLAGRMEDRGLSMGGVSVRWRHRPPHSLVSQWLLERWLMGRHGWDRSVAETYAVVPGGHHGVTPSRRLLSQNVRDQPQLIGDASWDAAQAELADFGAERAGLDSDDLAVLSQRPLSPLAQVALTAAVVLADWIASNEELFPYGIGVAPAPDRVSRAWEGLNLPGPWEPVPAARSASWVDSVLAERFSLPTGSMARPVQQAAVEVARNSAAPCLLIIEAPMGEGKTEAGLLAAEVLAERAGAGGVFVALPTMATSNAMFSRVHDWVRCLPDRRRGVDQTMFLAHGKAGLHDEFQDLFRGGEPTCVGVDDHQAPANGAAIAHQWLSGRRKGVLANFVVGTIDQVLFAGLKSRHLAMRHLALLNKVVVIDEVHATDVYMNVYLERVLGWLGAYGIPTVLMSATLPPDQRTQLLSAYTVTHRAAAADAARPSSSLLDRMQSGGRAAALRRRAEDSERRLRPVDVRESLEYPLITSTQGAGPPVDTGVPSSGRGTRIRIERLDDSDDALLRMLRTRLTDGGCVAVVRNTVGRAQHTARVVTDAFQGAAITLTHARFLAADRAAKDAALLELLGSNSTPADRKGPHIVVGTQVLEQSLDIDFDLLVTDLAPIDLVLQRIGRLHRHPRGAGERNRPAPLREPVCVITGADWDVADGPPRAVEGSRAIYGDSMLLRSALMLDEVDADGGTVSLPVDIPRLVRRAYDRDLVPPDGWSAALTEADEKARQAAAMRQKAASDFAVDLPKAAGSILGWTDGSAGDADDTVRGQAQVRDGDDTVEVVVVQRSGAELRVLPWVQLDGGSVLATEAEPGRSAARTAAGCTVRLPGQMTRPRRMDAVIGALETNGFAAWQQSPWLKGQLILVLDEELQAEMAGFSVRYDRELGLLVEREG